MQIEVELLTDWYLPWRRGASVPDEERQAYLELWRALFERLESAEEALVLRDYHSPNLIWRPQKIGLDRLGIIDFQDAMIGPSAYDVASLCQDARVTVDPHLAGQLLDRYVAARRDANPDFDETGFREAYGPHSAPRKFSASSFGSSSGMENPAICGICREWRPIFRRLSPIRRCNPCATGSQRLVSAKANHKPEPPDR